MELHIFGMNANSTKAMVVFSIFTMLSAIWKTLVLMFFVNALLHMDIPVSVFVVVVMVDKLLDLLRATKNT